MQTVEALNEVSCMPCENMIVFDNDVLIRRTAEMAINVIREQQAEIERLKEEKERAIRDIDLYIADAESDAKTPPRTGKGYSVGLGYGLLIAKEILQGIRKHG